MPSLPKWFLFAGILSQATRRIEITEVMIHIQQTTVQTKSRADMYPDKEQVIRYRIQPPPPNPYESTLVRNQHMCLI